MTTIHTSELARDWENATWAHELQVLTTQEAQVPTLSMIIDKVLVVTACLHTQGTIVRTQWSIILFLKCIGLFSSLQMFSLELVLWLSQLQFLSSFQLKAFTLWKVSSLVSSLLLKESFNWLAQLYILFLFPSDSIWAKGHEREHPPVINCGFNYLLFTFVVAVIGLNILFLVVVKRYEYSYGERWQTIWSKYGI